MGKEVGSIPVNVGFSDNGYAPAGTWTNTGSVSPATFNSRTITACYYGNPGGTFDFVFSGVNPTNEIRSIQVFHGAGNFTFHQPGFGLNTNGYASFVSSGDTRYTWNAAFYGQANAWSVAEANAGNVFYNVIVSFV